MPKQFTAADIATKESRDHYLARQEALKPKDRRRNHTSSSPYDTNHCTCKVCLATNRNSGRYNYARKAEAFPVWKADRTEEDHSSDEWMEGAPCEVCRWSGVMGACEWSGVGCESCRRYRESNSNVPSTRRHQVDFADLLATARPMKRRPQPRRHAIQAGQVVALDEDDDWMSVHTSVADEAEWEILAKD